MIKGSIEIPAYISLLDYPYVWPIKKLHLHISIEQAPPPQSAVNPDLTRSNAAHFWQS